jgi:Tol biopolymer transport system component
MAYYTRITASVAGCNGQAGGIAFSADGARVAYAARRAGKWHVVVDGQAGPGWDDVLRGSLAFSPDGRRIAYAGARDQRWYAVVDGVAGAGYNAVGGLVFSPDSQRFAYWAARGWPWRVIVIADGAEGKECSLIDGLLAFSPDSKHLAYVARDIGADRDAVVVDGVVRWSTGFLGASSPTFSPDSRHLAYEHWRSRSKTRQVVIDGAEGKQYEMMYAFAFDGPSVLHFGARQGRTLFRVEVKVSGGQMP